MTSILYKATFLPPAFSHETSFKMGPSLQKIIGSDMTELSRVDKSNDVTFHFFFASCQNDHL